MDDRLIIVDGISKSYGAQELFRGASFRLNAGERVGLVGRNGSGKTTLFRLIVGEEEPDAGSIAVPKNYTIGYVRQEPDFARETVLEEGCRGLPAAHRDQTWRVEKVLAGLGFSRSDMEAHPSILSGGFQVRLNLAKVLVGDANLLLLDEPTNYLDITSIRWMTRYLLEWRGELILVTHDRGFMDNVATHVMGIYRRTLRKIRGDTGKLYTQLAMDEEVYERTRLNDEKKRRKAEEFIRRFRAKARLANLVQSRIKTLEKRERLEELERERELDFSFVSRPFNGKPVLRARNLTFGYDVGRPLFTDLSLTVGPSDRICIVGKNGRGKTTLLKTLAGRLAPLAGEVALNPTAVFTYYAQSNEGELVDERTVLEEILAAAPGIDQQRARNICGMMMFEGDAALKKVKILSGGEKNRLMLGRIIATPVNLLLLDEPTNHLDMESCDALLEAVDAFDGAVVMVTHNEMLLHGLARRLVVFQGGGAGIFEGSYRRFLEDRGWDEDDAADEATEDGGKGREKRDRREERRLRAQRVRERSKALRPLEDRIAELERRIVGAETELEKLYKALESASESGDGDAVARASIGIHRCREEIEGCFESLESASARYEEQRALFDEQAEEPDGSP